MTGITLPFNEISEQYLNLPISYIQILFQNRKEWLYPQEKELIKVKNQLSNKQIRPIVHINIKLCIINLTGNFRSRAILELGYAKALNAQYIIIHCGTKGSKNPIPLHTFKTHLNDLVSLTQIPILLENSASKKCYGSTLDELKYISRGIDIEGFV
jgi:endonuclease IV